MNKKMYINNKYSKNQFNFIYCVEGTDLLLPSVSSGIVAVETRIEFGNVSLFINLTD